MWPAGVRKGVPEELMLVTSQPRLSAALQTCEPDEHDEYPVALSFEWYQSTYEAVASNNEKFLECGHGGLR